MADDPKVTETLPDEVSVRAHAIPGTMISVVDVTAIVTLFGGMLERSTSSILTAVKHIEDDSIRRFEAIEGRLTRVEISVSEHHTLAHDAKVASDARVKPVLTLVQSIVKNRKDIAIVLLFLVTAFVELFVGVAERAHP